MISGHQKLLLYCFVSIGLAVQVVHNWRALMFETYRVDKVDHDHLIASQQILAAAQYMPAPFDTLLSDDSSLLFAKVLHNWNETMELVNSKVDVFTPLILNETTARSNKKLACEVWAALTDLQNNSDTGTARVSKVLDRVHSPMQFYDWLENSKENAITLPEVFSDHCDTNWGLYSTVFPNDRTTNWNYQPRDPRWKDVVTDNPKVIALFSVQHHNLSDPELDNKVLSLPIGGVLSNEVWDRLKARPHDLLRSSDYDLTVGGRPYEFRATIFCHLIDHNGLPLPDHDLIPTSNDDFLRVLSITRFIWTPPGLGYDCHRNWDVLLSGAIPILERGFGLERTYAYLPSFWVDSYYNLTPEMLASAYPLFVALRREFDFSRLGQEYWINLVQSVAAEKSDQLLRVKHPFAKQRVIWPCEEGANSTSLREGALRYCKTPASLENISSIK